MTGPPAVPRRFEERNVPPALQGLVSRTLRGGVVLASVLMAAGVAWEAMVGHGSLLGAAAPTSGAGVSSLVHGGGPSVLVLVGVFILAITPLTRVLISVALFASVRDRAFTAITLFVLTVLAATIAVGVLR